MATKATTAQKEEQNAYKKQYRASKGTTVSRRDWLGKPANVKGVGSLFNFFQVT